MSTSKFLKVTKGMREILSQRNCWRIPKSVLKLEGGEAGILQFRDELSDLRGNVLLDESLTFPVGFFNEDLWIFLLTRVLLSLQVQVINFEEHKISGDYLEKKIGEAFRKRVEWSKESFFSIGEEEAFRCVNGIGDGLPALAVDVFGRSALVHLYSKHWAQYLENISQGLLQNGWRDVKDVFLADHVRYGEGEKVPREIRAKKPHWEAKSWWIGGKESSSPPAEAKLVVKERGRRFAVDLSKGSSAGLFLDQRDNREKVAEILRRVQDSRRLEEKKKKQEEEVVFLNTFSFTCSFSVYASGLEGVKTVNIDFSHPSLQAGRQNMLLNGVPEDQLSSSLNLPPQPLHHFLCSDVMERLVAFQNERKAFDVVLLDPPTASRVHIRKQGRSKLHLFTVEKDYARLVRLAAPLVKPNGYLVAFVNTHSVSKDTLFQLCNQGFSLAREELKEEFEDRLFLSARKKLRMRSPISIPKFICKINSSFLKR